MCETQTALYLTVKPTVRRLCGLLLPWDSRLLVRKGRGSASEVGSDDLWVYGDNAPGKLFTCFPERKGNIKAGDSGWGIT